MRIVFTDEAEREISDAVDYLIGTDGSPSVVDELQADIKDAERLLLQFPHSSPPLKQGMRRCLLSRLSYQLVYRVEADIIRVYAFVHLSRKPDYWRKRVLPQHRKPSKS